MKRSLVNISIQLITGLILFIQPAIAAPGLIGSQGTNSPATGSWSLRKIGESDSRTVKFWIENGQLKGVYISKDNQEKAITDAKLENSMLYFRVPDFGLYFEMRSGRDSFEGKMIYTTEKLPPESVRMSRMR